MRLLAFLIDEYGDSDEVSKGHTVLTFDIEVEMNSGLPSTEEAKNANDCYSIS
jgi:hypothetical protein